MGAYITKPKQNESNPAVMESVFVAICPVHRIAVPTVIRIGDYEIFKIILPYTSDESSRNTNRVQLRYRNLRKIPYGPHGRRYHYLPRRRRVRTPLRVKVLKKEAWKLLENKEEVKASLRARLRRAARENRWREKVFLMRRLRDRKYRMRARHGEPDSWEVENPSKPSSDSSDQPVQLHPQTPDETPVNTPKY